MIFNLWCLMHGKESIKTIGCNSSFCSVFCVLRFLCLNIDKDLSYKIILIDLINLNLYNSISPSILKMQKWQTILTRRIRYKMFKPEYCNDCVHEKLLPGSKTIKKSSFNSHVYWDSMCNFVDLIRYTWSRSFLF